VSYVPMWSVKYMKKVDQILNKQKDLQKELDGIQSHCKHKHEVIRQLHHKNEWWWQCQECNKYTRLTTQDEIYKYLSD